MKKSSSLTGMMKLILILAVLSVPAVLYGQKPADFTGTWVQDKSKGDEILPGYTNRLMFIQTEKSIALKSTFINDKDKTEESEERTLTPDGKEAVTRTTGWKETETTTLSPDKRTLTIKNLQFVDRQVIESYEIYSLSADGKVLTLKSFNAAAKDHAYTNYFNKR